MRSRLAVAVFLLMGLANPASAQVHQIKIGVNGLVCAVCAFSVEKALSKLDGVASANVDLKDKTVNVPLKPQSSFNPEKLRATVKKAGFQVRDFQDLEAAEGHQWAVLHTYKSFALI